MDFNNQDFDPRQGCEPLFTLEEKVEKIYTDLYLGEGRENLSITTRLALQEDLTARISSNLNKIAWSTIATALAVVGQLVLKLIHL